MNLNNGALFDLVIGLPLVVIWLAAVALAYAKDTWPFGEDDE